MKLFILRPIDEHKDPWYPWYDKVFGFVVRASDEARARILASQWSGAELERAWLDVGLSICEELLSDGREQILIKDERSA